MIVSIPGVYSFVFTWLLGAAFGAFTAWQIYGHRAWLYEMWYDTLKWIVEDYYGGRVESNKKTGDCGVNFYPGGNKEA